MCNAEARKELRSAEGHAAESLEDPGGPRIEIMSTWPKAHIHNSL